MKTEAEIRERIAQRQKDANEEEMNGGIGGEDWNLAMTAIAELQWALGE